MAGIHALHGIAVIFLWTSVVPMVWIADDLRFATQLSNVYGNAIRAKLANAQTTRSVADSFSSFVTQNLQTICSLYHRHPRFFHKSSEYDSIANTWIPAIYATPGAKICFCSPPGCGKAKEKSRTFFAKNGSGCIIMLCTKLKLYRKIIAYLRWIIN